MRAKLATSYTAPEIRSCMSGRDAGVMAACAYKLGDHRASRNRKRKDNHIILCIKVRTVMLASPEGADIE